MMTVEFLQNMQIVKIMRNLVHMALINTMQLRANTGYLLMSNIQICTKEQYITYCALGITETIQCFLMTYS